MAETDRLIGLIDPLDGTSIFLNTQPIALFGDVWRKRIHLLVRHDPNTNKAYIIAARSEDDAHYPPREFESLDAAHVFLRLTEGEP